MPRIDGTFFNQDKLMANVHGKAIIRAKKMGITRIALSLSHSKKYAIASAVGEAKDSYWQPSD